MTTTTENFNEMTPVELRFALENKEKAVADLSQWLSKHEPNETEYKHVWEDRNDLNKEIHTIKRLLEQHASASSTSEAKSFNRSLNESDGVGL
jgi:hypothetical protein